MPLNPTARLINGERMRETRNRCEPMKTDRSLPFTNMLAGASQDLRTWRQP